MDAFDHPDLAEVGARMRRHLADVAAAERWAARIAARRRRSLRDLLIDAEDRDADVTITTATGNAVDGAVIAVGADHVCIATSDRVAVVAIPAVVAVEFPA